MFQKYRISRIRIRFPKNSTYPYVEIFKPFFYRKNNNKLPFKIILYLARNRKKFILATENKLYKRKIYIRIYLGCEKNAKKLKQKFKVNKNVKNLEKKKIKNSEKLKNFWKKKYILKAGIRCSKILRIPIRIRIRDTPNFAYPYLAYTYFLEHCPHIPIIYL